jgi:hypothetical protein
MDAQEELSLKKATHDLCQNNQFEKNSCNNFYHHCLMPFLSHLRQAT